MNHHGLPFNLDDLLHQRTVESHRVELKATWNDFVKASVVRTISAFANDLLNLNGGYVILGVREEGGRAVLPPEGLGALDLDRVQREIRGACKQLQPEYQPYLFPAEFEGRTLLVLWAPGGDNRPYRAPEDVRQKGSPRHYYVRQGPATVKAEGDFLRQLLEATAKVPFDDRRSLTGKVEDLSPTLVRRFLHQIGSKLTEGDHTGRPIDDRDLFRQLRLVLPINSHEVPRNVGLIFFNEDPERFFPGARIEVVRFRDGAGGDVLDEEVFSGPLSHQLLLALNRLSSLGGTVVEKVPGQAEAERASAYPYEAVEEALVNAVYHRGYDGPPEPTKVYLYPDRMEITTYPGPVPGLEPAHFLPGSAIPAVPARNRRIGDLLKELRLAEGRGTGIPKIQRALGRNGSPPARFDFDAQRTYFRTTLPIHPRFREA